MDSVEPPVAASAEAAVQPTTVETDQKPRTFKKAEKAIKTIAQLGEWHKSHAFADLVGFIMKSNEKVRGRPRSGKRTLNAKGHMIIDFLGKASDWIDDIPPQTQSQRFGNKAFRDWLARLHQHNAEFHHGLLGAELHAQGASEELGVYFGESFGNQTRIDYGTGHELNFVAWMAAMHKIGVFIDDDLTCLVLDVFCCYLKLMRKLQSVYWLEPAGSKGVWGLDDYQFLPLLWGAAQLDGQSDILPSAVGDKDLAKAEAENFMYMGCIDFIFRMKTGRFGEHSPMLNDISAVPRWSKINQGLIKMYDKEVLGKFPVMQHFFFGTILPFVPCPEDHPVKLREAKRPRKFGL